MVSCSPVLAGLERTQCKFFEASELLDRLARGRGGSYSNPFAKIASGVMTMLSAMNTGPQSPPVGGPES